MKNICNSYEEHMENENININKNIIKNKDRDKGVIGEEEEETKILDMWETQFNDFYSLYPKKVKKQDVKKWFQKINHRMNCLVLCYIVWNNLGPVKNGKKMVDNLFHILLPG